MLKRRCYWCKLLYVMITLTSSPTAFSLIFSILGLALFQGAKLLWKLLKTLPLWWPYASIVLILFILTPVHSTGVSNTFASPFG